MALDNNQKFDEFIENFRRKNGYSENESRRDEILALQSHYALKAEESRLPQKIYYRIKEALLRNSCDFHLYVFGWDSHLHQKIVQ